MSSVLPFLFWDTCAPVRYEVGWQCHLGHEQAELRSQAPLQSPRPAFPPLAGFRERLRGTQAEGQSRRWPCASAVSAARCVFGYERSSSSACSC